MENVLGLLRIRVIRGINLAKRDVRSSDPYVIVRMGKQKLKTRVVKKNLNPEWNEQLTLAVTDPNIPVKLQVYDYDRFTPDVKMGNAEFSIREFVEAQRLQLVNLPSGIVIKKLIVNRQNCLSEESPVVWRDGKITQHMFLRLRNVECGEIELELNWILIPAGPSDFTQ